MCCFRKTPRTLAIIGNGFDLNHGYKTDYKSFVDSTESIYLQKFKLYCYNESIHTWYQFEENICDISEKMFSKSFADNSGSYDKSKELEELTNVFENIHILLKQYLKREMASRPICKNNQIEKYLNKNAIAINFNYTNLAEVYTKSMIYVHGSIEENDIILGYDYRNEPCLAQFEDMQWSKSICRESLAFRRYYLRKRKYNPRSNEYKDLIKGLEEYHFWENTGRGIDDEVKTFIKKYNTIHKFLKKYRKNAIVPKINYKKIETIVVLGHGIQADKVFLKSMIEKCNNLKKVVIFRYNGEEQDSYEDKVSFFKCYCKNIEQEEY